MNREDRRAVLAVARVRRQIAAAVDAIVAALGGGGRLFFVGAGTVLVACNPTTTRGAPADVIIAPAPGPEVLAGSTRLKAGTATKLVLNTLTTAAMARLGKVYGNRMVDLQPRSAKLRERAVRVITEIAGVRRPRARRVLAESGGSVRVAIVMARCGLSARGAARVLREAGGSLREALQESSRK